MAEPHINASRRGVLGLLAASSLMAAPAAALAAGTDRSEWEAIVNKHAAAWEASGKASEREDAACSAFWAESPPRPPLQIEVTVEIPDGQLRTMPIFYASEAELRRPCPYEGTILGVAYAKARESLLPLWDDWATKRAALEDKHQVKERTAEADQVAQIAYELEDQLMEMPAPDLEALLHKVTIAWGEKCDRGDPLQEHKLAILADLKRLARTTH